MSKVGVYERSKSICLRAFSLRKGFLHVTDVNNAIIAELHLAAGKVLAVVLSKCKRLHLCTQRKVLVK